MCEARGVPNATFAWRRVGGAIVASTGAPAENAHNLALAARKYEVESATLGPITTRSVLYVSNVTERDYGAYECIARNSEG